LKKKGGKKIGKGGEKEKARRTNCRSLPADKWQWPHGRGSLGRKEKLFPQYRRSRDWSNLKMSEYYGIKERGKKNRKGGLKTAPTLVKETEEAMIISREMRGGTGGQDGKRSAQALKHHERTVAGDNCMPMHSCSQKSDSGGKKGDYLWQEGKVISFMA